MFSELPDLQKLEQRFAKLQQQSDKFALKIDRLQQQDPEALCQELKIEMESRIEQIAPRLDKKITADLMKSFETRIDGVESKVRSELAALNEHVSNKLDSMKAYVDNGLASVVE